MVGYNKRAVSVSKPTKGLSQEAAYIKRYLTHLLIQFFKNGRKTLLHECRPTQRTVEGSLLVLLFNFPGDRTLRIAEDGYDITRPH